MDFGLGGGIGCIATIATVECLCSRSKLNRSLADCERSATLSLHTYNFRNRAALGAVFVLPLFKPGPTPMGMTPGGSGGAGGQGDQAYGRLDPRLFTMACLQPEELCFYRNI